MTTTATDQKDDQYLGAINAASMPLSIRYPRLSQVLGCGRALWTSMPSDIPSACPEEDETLERCKVDVIGTDETCLTFRLHGEDHTLANALRYVLMKNIDVEFCGYSIPHPSDNFVNIRVQTLGKPAVEVFRQALHDLMTMSEHIKSTFQVAFENRPLTQ